MTGPGTEFLNEIMSPFEYVSIRTLGIDGVSMVRKEKSLKMAKELEFIVMKGDEYTTDRITLQSTSLWKRSSSCVHRSPPGAPKKTGVVAAGRKRMILSLDLADGKDDQEWYEISRERGWRSGMTQRKSHLVS